MTQIALQHYLKRISAQVKVHQAILFGSYGLLTAQQARSATTLTKKAFAVVDGTSGALIRGSHALSSSKRGIGNYVVTFDRHIDNCAITATNGFDSTASGDSGPLRS